MVANFFLAFGVLHLPLDAPRFDRDEAKQALSIQARSSSWSASSSI
jgi:hypothetical protein